MTEPYDVSTSDDHEQGLRRLVDRTGKTWTEPLDKPPPEDLAREAEIPPGEADKPMVEIEEAEALGHLLTSAAWQARQTEAILEQLEALRRSVVSLAETYSQLNRRVSAILALLSDEGDKEPETVRRHL